VRVVWLVWVLRRGDCDAGLSGSESETWVVSELSRRIAGIVEVLKCEEDERQRLRGVVE
jgi:hypothetical protein